MNLKKQQQNNHNKREINNSKSILETPSHNNQNQDNTFNSKIDRIKNTIKYIQKDIDNIKDEFHPDVCTESKMYYDSSVLYNNNPTKNYYNLLDSTRNTNLHKPSPLFKNLNYNYSDENLNLLNNEINTKRNIPNNSEFIKMNKISPINPINENENNVFLNNHSGKSKDIEHSQRSYCDTSKIQNSNFIPFYSNNTNEIEKYKTNINNQIKRNYNYNNNLRSNSSTKMKADNYTYHLEDDQKRSKTAIKNTNFSNYYNNKHLYKKKLNESKELLTTDLNNITYYYNMGGNDGMSDLESLKDKLSNNFHYNNNYNQSKNNKSNIPLKSTQRNIYNSNNNTVNQSNLNNTNITNTTNYQELVLDTKTVEKHIHILVEIQKLIVSLFIIKNFLRMLNHLMIFYQF